MHNIIIYRYLLNPLLFLSSQSFASPSLFKLEQRRNLLENISKNILYEVKINENSMRANRSITSAFTNIHYYIIRKASQSKARSSPEFFHPRSSDGCL